MTWFKGLHLSIKLVLASIFFLTLVASPVGADEIAKLLAEASASKQTQAPPPEAVNQPAKVIEFVLFDKLAKTSELIIKADGKMPEPKLLKLENKFYLDIAGLSLKATLPTEIPHPFKSLSYREDAGVIRFVIELPKGFDAEAVVYDDELIVRPVDKAVLSASGASQAPQVSEGIDDKAKDKVITLDFQDADVVPILRLLGDVSGYNMVIHPQVQGKITMKLTNVKWQKALEIILKTFNLDKSVEGNIIRVAPVAVFEKELNEIANIRKAQGSAEELVTRTFTLNYITVENAENFINKAKVLSPRGSISSDTRSRTLIIKDIPQSLAEIKRLLDTIDKATTQVLIEARIVEINSENRRDLGIEWGASWRSPDFRFSTVGSASGAAIPGGYAGTRGAITASTTGVGTTPIVSLAAPASAGALTFGYLNAKQTVGLDIRISALEQAGVVKIISSPHIMTIENEKAEITHGSQIPVTTPGTGNNPPTTTYRDANLKLAVTPNVTPDDSIFLNLEITNDSPNYAQRDPLTGNVPVDKREAKTKVIVKDGSTVVIGGIIKTTEGDSEGAVPGLSKIPILGWLFKNESKTKSNRELLIFITPRIVRQ